MRCYAVLQILCTRVEGCHGDRFLDYLSYDLSKHPQVCSLDTWGSQRMQPGYTKCLVRQECIVCLSQAQWLFKSRLQILRGIKIIATSFLLWAVQHVLSVCISAKPAELCQRCENVSNIWSKISHDFRSLSWLRGCDPSELKSLWPHGPGSAEMKLRVQSWGKRGQGPNGGWGAGHWLQ